MEANRELCGKTAKLALKAKKGVAREKRCARYVTVLARFEKIVPGRFW
jgi:hypothetical protein